MRVVRLFVVDFVGESRVAGPFSKLESRHGFCIPARKTWPECLAKMPLNRGSSPCLAARHPTIGIWWKSGCLLFRCEAPSPLAGHANRWDAWRRPTLSGCLTVTEAGTKIMGDWNGKLAGNQILRSSNQNSADSLGSICGSCGWTHAMIPMTHAFKIN